LATECRRELEFRREIPVAVCFSVYSVAKKFMKNIFLLLSAIVIFSCRQGPKSYEYYAAKEKLSKADIGYIVEEEYQLANKGLKMLETKIDSTTVEEIFLLKEEIDKWAEIRKRVPLKEISREQAGKYLKVVEFYGKWLEFLKTDILGDQLDK
jgi:hypothetical protein